MMRLNEQLDHVPPFWLGWTGTDAAHHVNVLYALNFDTWATSFVKATLPETAVGGTQVGFILGTSGSEPLVAWTGTDAAHHLNAARARRLETLAKQAETKPDQFLQEFERLLPTA
jgi:hypothetical protein